MAILKPSPGFPDQVLAGDFHAPQHDRGGRAGGESHLRHVRPHGNPVPSPIHDEGSHEAGLPGVHLREHRERPRVVRVGNEGLCAVEKVPVTVIPAAGARPDVLGVRAGLGLGERVPEDHFAGRRAGKVALLLVLGSEQQDALDADGGVRERDQGNGKVDAGESLNGHEVFTQAEAQASIFPRDHEPEDARALQTLEKLPGNGMPRLDRSRVEA